MGNTKMLALTALLSLALIAPAASIVAGPGGDPYDCGDCDSAYPTGDDGSDDGSWSGGDTETNDGTDSGGADTSDGSDDGSWSGDDSETNDGTDSSDDDTDSSTETEQDWSGDDSETNDGTDTSSPDSGSEDDGSWSGDDSETNDGTDTSDSDSTDTDEDIGTDDGGSDSTDDTSEEDSTDTSGESDTDDEAGGSSGGGSTGGGSTGGGTGDGDGDSGSGDSGSGDGSTGGGDSGDSNDDPAVSFTFSPSNPEPGQEVTFTADASDSDGSIQSIEWDLDDDGAFDDATGETAKRSFSSEGDYKVTVRATDDDGAENTISDTVMVRADSGSDSDDDDEDDGDSSGGSGGGSVGGGEIIIGSPEPSMNVALSSDTVEYNQPVTVSGSFENVDSPRQVTVYFGGQQVSTLSSADTFSTSFEANIVGENEVRVVSGELEKTMVLNVNPAVRIDGINAQTFLRPSERHEVCVEITAPSSTEVQLYENDELVGTRNTGDVACFTRIAPEDSNSVTYRAVATSGSARDVEEKTISVIPEETGTQPSNTPTGGFFSETSNIALSIAAILLAILAAVGYRKREQLKTYVSGIRA
ncbi:PKD domain-containing protein [Candidatus Nanohalococcus occultus]|uniref:Carbohydate-binding protein with PKD domain n=1 Tax=Candidatus Nanohalococcus occultus TaxID=2978047 RepID=A0ABY8CCX3_9ARCH|nr:putative carbohydate-binding protein with PKD domain [Candidatus Nanohaloarchaeota archaeon SVXNc]